jgi:intein-encoded DNA endonuclease-like protein
MGKASKISQEIAQQIIERYNNGLGLATAGKPWGYSQRVVETLLKINNIKKRNYVESKQITRLYSVNDNFFKEQNSEMAYILGFLAADGNISKVGNEIRIQLHKQDTDLLEQIKEKTQSTRPLKYYINNSGSETAVLVVFSSEWKRDLYKYNITPQKTCTLQQPNNLNEKYFIDYIRGFFDGDGCIYYEEKNPKHCSWAITGASKNVINWIANVLINNYNLKTTKGVTERISNNNIPLYTIGFYGCNNIEKIYKALYYNGCLCLNRKKKKFETILDNIPRDSTPLK